MNSERVAERVLKAFPDLNDQQFRSQAKRDPLMGLALAMFELVSGRPERTLPILKEVGSSGVSGRFRF